MNANSICLKQNKILIPSETSNVNDNRIQALTFNKNLEGLGYTLSPAALKAVSLLTEKNITSFYKEIISILKELRGVKRYVPMYPNFPQQVLNASDLELYSNAFIHYFSVFVADITDTPEYIWVPKYNTKTRKPLTEKTKTKITVLYPAQTQDLFAYSKNLMSANTSISQTDKEELKWLIKNTYFELPESFSNKENMATICALLYKEFGFENSIKSYFNTATDILRFAVALSEGDVSLALPNKFGKLNRHTRKVVLGLLEKSNNILEDMNRFKSRWIRLGEKLHPGEFQSKFPKAYFAFTTLRNNQHVETFNSKVELLIKSNAHVEAATLLQSRPGEFARRLDQLLRANVSNTTILCLFQDVVDVVSTPVLLQVIAHFKNRLLNDFTLRVVFPKGNTCKVQALPANLLNIEPEFCKSVINICENALLSKFKTLPPLGKVFVTPELENYLVPFSQRSASNSLHTLVRGSKIKLEVSKNIVRFFIWWKDIDSERVDVDLSACMYDENWEQLGAVSYFNLKSATKSAYHSGDLTSAPKGACEFIDVDLNKIACRYIVMMVNSFTGQPFSSIPESSAGWMMREDVNSGEIFEARTVSNKLDLTSNSKGVMPLIIDTVDRQVIWADAAIKMNRGWNVNTASDTIQLIGKAFTQIKKPNLYDLLRLHAVSRGNLVKSAKDADIVFDTIITPFELDKIMSEFMSNGTPKEKIKVLKNSL